MRPGDVVFVIVRDVYRYSRSWELAEVRVCEVRDGFVWVEGIARAFIRGSSVFARQDDAIASLRRRVDREIARVEKRLGELRKVRAIELSRPTIRRIDRAAAAGVEAYRMATQVPS